MTIWKYALSTTDHQEVQMPAGAQILCLQVQLGIPCLWAVVDETAPTRTRLIRIYGMGHFMDERHPGKFIGTYQLNGGSLVFHAFDLGEK